MDDFLVVGTTPSGTEVYLSELSSRTLADNGINPNTYGLYLYEASEDPSGLGIRVLASVPCIDAAYRMMDLLRLRHVTA
jgi:hypothetical protein